MPLGLGRVLIAAVFAEVVPIILLVVLVALFGPRERTAAQAYAERLGQWVGPIGGTLMCFLTAWWTVRALKARQVLYGFVVGLLAAFIDVAILIASDTAFQWLFAASNFGRLMAGTFGGLIASRRSQTSSNA